jgi:hypothetical protein
MDASQVHGDLINVSKRFLCKPLLMFLREGRLGGCIDLQFNHWKSMVWLAILNFFTRQHLGLSGVCTSTISAQFFDESLIQSDHGATQYDSDVSVGGDASHFLD